MDCHWIAYWPIRNFHFIISMLVRISRICDSFTKKKIWHEVFGWPESFQLSQSSHLRDRIVLVLMCVLSIMIQSRKNIMAWQAKPLTALVKILRKCGHQNERLLQLKCSSVTNQDLNSQQWYVWPLQNGMKHLGLSTRQILNYHVKIHAAPEILIFLHQQSECLVTSLFLFQLSMTTSDPTTLLFGDAEVWRSIHLQVRAFLRMANSIHNRFTLRASEW